MIDTWLTDVLRREGWPAYTERAADRGGPTKGGVTLATLKAWRHHLGLSAPGIEDLKHLDEAEARDIFRFWYLERWYWLGHEDLICLCADWAVTSGPDDPIKAIQRYLGVAVDGVVGRETRDAYRRLPDVTGLYRHVWQERLRFYVALVLNDGDVRAFLREHPTTQLHNLRGWLNRALDLPATPSTGGGRDAHPLLATGPAGPAPRSPDA